MVLKKVLIFVGLFIGIFILLCVISHFGFSIKENSLKSEREKKFSRNEFPADELKVDLQYFRKLLEEVHPDPYYSLSKTDFDNEFKIIEQKIVSPISSLEFYKMLAPLVSRLNDEHVTISPSSFTMKKKETANTLYFPFNIIFIDGKGYIKKNYSTENKIITGNEIAAINGVSINSIADTLINYFSGTRPEQKMIYLQNNFTEFLNLIYDFSGPFKLEIKNSAGSSEIFNISGITAAQKAEYSKNDFSYTINDKSRTAVFTLKSFDDNKGILFDFLKKMFSLLKEKGITKLIIDIRGNKGGDTSNGDLILDYLTDKPFTQITGSEFKISGILKEQLMNFIPGFIRWLPIQRFHPLLKTIWSGKDGQIVDFMFSEYHPSENNLRFNGKVFVFIDAGSMSSASLFPATIQKYKIGTLVGEKSGGYPTHHGNMWDIELPNSGLIIGMPSCINHGNGTGPVMPDREIKFDLQSVSNSSDPLIEYVNSL